MKHFIQDRNGNGELVVEHVPLRQMPAPASSQVLRLSIGDVTVEVERLALWSLIHQIQESESYRLED